MIKILKVVVGWKLFKLVQRHNISFCETHMTRIVLSSLETRICRKRNYLLGRKIRWAHIIELQVSKKCYVRLYLLFIRRIMTSTRRLECPLLALLWELNSTNTSPWHSDPNDVLRVTTSVHIIALTAS